MATGNTHNMVAHDPERESVAEGLADALFRLQGCYTTSLLRLCRTLVDKEGVAFVNAIIEELDSENEAMEEGNRP